MTRLCVFCKHFELEMGHGPWSDITPGDRARIECDKGHWEMRQDEGAAKYRENIHTAKTCPDYDEVPR